MISPGRIRQLKDGGRVLDLAAFVMRTGLPAAEEVVARNERIALTARDTVRILELLDHPPAPPPAMRAAAKRRSKRR
jgi:uncharacterized protein (DUF1778 family)